MKKRFKTIALVAVSLAVLVAVSTHLSFITVTNHSGKPLTGVAVLSEAFSLSCGSLQPNQSRSFVRWPRGSCGVTIAGQDSGRRFSSGAPFMITDSHGYRIRIALQPDYSFRLTATPEPLLNLPAIVSPQ